MSGLRQFGTQHGGDNVFLSLNVEGESTACERGQEIILRSGDAVLFSGADGGCAINRPATVRFAAMRIPVSGAGAACRQSRRRCDAADTEGNGLASAARQLPPRDRHGARPGLAGALCAGRAHIHDLVALSLGAARDYRGVAEERSVRAARLRTIKADIAANLGDCELNVNSVAARHGVTARYVQKLFASEGATFSECVLSRRLAAAYRLLSDPRFAHRSISSIAFDLGFSDLSYFNRTFRRRHEAMPTEVRIQESGDRR